MSPLPQFMLCRKSSGSAHLGSRGAARGLGESATHRKTQWVTKQGLGIQQSWAVDPHGPGYGETRGQPTLKVSQWFTKTHRCILRNRGGHTAATGEDAHGQYKFRVVPRCPGAQTPRHTEDIWIPTDTCQHTYTYTQGIHTYTHTAYQLCNPGTLSHLPKPRFHPLSWG